MSATRFDHTHACALTDFPEWRKGRTRYSAWVIPTDAIVTDRIECAQQHLAPWLHPKGKRQGHITLYVCGFIAQTPRFADDILTSQLAAQTQALNALALPCFELAIGPLASFSTTAFLEVKDSSQSLASARKALTCISQEVRQSPYYPHVTVGLYRQVVSYAELNTRMAEFNLPTVPLNVTAFELVSFDAKDPQGELQVDARIQLS